MSRGAGLIKQQRVCVPKETRFFDPKKKPKITKKNEGIRKLNDEELSELQPEYIEFEDPE